MSCRRVQRELIERIRFGQLDGESVPHLSHLSDCPDCRDVVGMDRFLVQQLQIALDARVAGHAPSPLAWQAVLQEVRADADARRSTGRWVLSFAGWMRAGAAASALLLAVALTGGQYVFRGTGAHPSLVTSSIVREPMEFALLPSQAPQQEPVAIPFPWTATQPVGMISGTMPYADNTGLPQDETASSIPRGGARE